MKWNKFTEGQDFEDDDRIAVIYNDRDIDILYGKPDNWSVDVEEVEYYIKLPPLPDPFEEWFDDRYPGADAMIDFGESELKEAFKAGQNYGS